MFLVDASVWVAVFDRDDRFHSESATLIESDEELATLDLAFYEVSNALGVKRRKPVLARGMSELIERRCRENVVRVNSGWTDSTLRLAAGHGLTAYDAAYVAAAKRNGWTLVSTDIADLVSKGLAVAPDAAV